MKNEDMRVIKTREKLFDAYLKLIAQKVPEDISIQELTKLANINRVTFYKHFQNLTNFHTIFIESHILALYRFMEPLNYKLYTKGFEYDAILKLLHFIQEHASIYKILFTSRFIPHFSRDLLLFFQQKVSQHTEELAMFDFPGTGVNKDIVAWYGVSALFGTIFMWVRQDFPYSPEELAQSFVKLTSRSI